MTTATYTPTITEALPLTREQRRLAAQNFRGFWVEANSKRVNKYGVRIVRYLLTVMPGGWVKCPCEAGKWSKKPCCHKLALFEYLEGEQRHADKNAAADPQMTFACARDARPMPKCVECGKPVSNREFAYCTACAHQGALRTQVDRPKHETAVLASHVPEEFSVFRS